MGARRYEIYLQVFKWYLTNERSEQVTLEATSYEPYGPASNFLRKLQKETSRTKAVSVEVIGTENTRKAKLKTRTAPTKTTILLLKSVSLKMSKSEHSDS